MKRLLSNRWFGLSAGLILVVLITLVSCAWYYRVWSWRDMQVYQMMSRECHPVWQDLHWGRVHVGQDVEDVIEATAPVSVERIGAFVLLNYQGGDGLLHFTGVTITAKNGRLAGAAAWSCTWDRVFFDELTQEDRQAFADAYKAHRQPLKKEREQAEQVAAPVAAA